MVVQFIRMNRSTFTGCKVKEDLRGFVNEIEKIFRVLHASDYEGVEFSHIS